MTKHKASAYSKGDFAIYKGEAIIRADTILRASQPPSVAWNTSKGDTIFIDADSMLEAYTANTAALTDPANISVHPQVFRCEGFPRPLTQADIDALYKRALDAEDHLRAEVSRCQSIIASQAEMERVASHHRTAAWDARKEVDAVNERLRMSRKSARDNLKEHCKVSQAAIAERDDTIVNLRREVASKRDATIAAMRAELGAVQVAADIAIKAAQQAAEIIKARDQTIADLQKELQEWKDAALEASEQY